MFGHKDIDNSDQADSLSTFGTVNKFKSYISSIFLNYI